MTPPPALRYRFGIFELDATAGELRRNGVRIKLHAQPLQVLQLLVGRPGELVAREDICRQLWPDGSFVDFDHGLNSAINRLREALGDRAANPRFVETLARRGYRFLAPVEILDGPPASPATEQSILVPHSQTPEAAATTAPAYTLLATPADLPRTRPATARTLFLLLQLMYLGFYTGALANLAELNELFAPLAHAHAAFTTLMVTAMLLIPVRLFLGSAVLFHAPGFREKYLRLWPVVLLPLDALWSLAPFLLLHHMSTGLALACTAPLVYSPFAQRALVLMAARQQRP